jgi:hypothetical protein
MMERNKPVNHAKVFVKNDSIEHITGGEDDTKWSIPVIPEI